MKFQIEKEELVYDGFFKIKKAKIIHDTFAGKHIEATREVFERGDGAAILLVEKDTNCILLISQFRFPTCKHDNGWLTEIPAGIVEKGEKPKTCITREVMEELGYKIKNPKLIHQFYTSPGGCTEQIFLFYAEVTSKDKIEIGGGKASEAEDIKIEKWPIAEIGNKISEIIDAKTLIALQWFLLQK